MEYLKAFETRFQNEESFDGKQIALTEKLQSTRSELQEAYSEIETLKSLVDEVYKQGINSVMDVSTLLEEANNKTPFRNITFPKDRNTITYGQKAGYSQYVTAFYAFTTQRLVEKYIESQDNLTSMSREVASNTIDKASLKRTAGINLPALADEKEATKLTPSIPVHNRVDSGVDVSSPKAKSPEPEKVATPAQKSKITVMKK